MLNSSSDASPKLNVAPRKGRRSTAPLQIVFIGLSLTEHTDKTFEYFLVVHDGNGVVQSEHNRMSGPFEAVGQHILELCYKYGTQRGHKIELFAISPSKNPDSIEYNPRLRPGFIVDQDRPPSFPAKIWLHLDCMPMIVSVKEKQFSLQSRAVAAIEQALEWMSPRSTSTLKVFLYDIGQQARLTSPKLWKCFTQSGQHLTDRKLKVSFFSATPSGGGVALMRHGLLRIWKQAGLCASWYVPQGDSSVFNVTKRKFHNVLQGVADPQVLLNDEDKKLFETWTRFNFETFWSDMKGPISADVIVIDDPQMTALIPIIRNCNPHAKIVFRSHIEIRSDLVSQGQKQICTTWDYLWSFIRQADVFVAHPVEYFVPDVVKEHMPVVYMPPSTDPLDGLNKPIPEFFQDLYRHDFDEAVQRAHGFSLDWSRPYIIQVARFDPSKGIPDLVEGYRLFREELAATGNQVTPQLILTGHTSVDDPDASVVLGQLHDQLSSDSFNNIRADVHAIRCPPSDRLLNALLRGADVVCQVSTREGYEIKVSEALQKGLWVIATKAGGIPLQCRDGIDCTLVDAGHPHAISAALATFYSQTPIPRPRRQQSLRNTDPNNTSAPSSSVGGASEMSFATQGGVHNDASKPVAGRFDSNGNGPSEENFVVANATMWQHLWARLIDRQSENGVKEWSGRKMWDVVVELMD